MLAAEANDPLYRVERDAPMGPIMRRGWLPADQSEDDAPVRVHLPGEAAE